MRLYKPIGLVFILFTILTFVSCNDKIEAPEGTPVKVAEIPVLADYLDSIRQQFEMSRVYKSIEHNGKTEQMWLDAPDWNKQMDFFYSSNISPVQLEDNYHLMLYESYDTTRYIIRAKDASLFTNEITWLLMNDEIYSISITNQRQTFLFDFQQNLQWLATGKAEIKIRQKSLLSDATLTSILLEFQ